MITRRSLLKLATLASAALLPATAFAALVLCTGFSALKIPEKVYCPLGDPNCVESSNFRLIVMPALKLWLPCSMDKLSKGNDFESRRGRICVWKHERSIGEDRRS